MRITELLSPGDCRIDEALALAARVFNEVEAPIYSKSGAEHFMAFVNGRELRECLASGNHKMYICSESCTVIGMMMIREGSHISLAFVDGEYRGTGVGRELFSRIAEDNPHVKFTVHAAPPAEGFYRRLGFVPTDMERLEDGILYIPMERKPD
ncbi:MAG: GNAT family N-acetyltransferase [Oscillospiraceae bacterium]|nr:GNAT family N-acetyltransferase [Oscillospiraceae bacterium]